MALCVHFLDFDFSYPMILNYDVSFGVDESNSVTETPTHQEMGANATEDLLMINVSEFLDSIETPKDMAMDLRDDIMTMEYEPSPPLGSNLMNENDPHLGEELNLTWKNI